MMSLTIGPDSLWLESYKRGKFEDRLTHRHHKNAKAEIKMMQLQANSHQIAWKPPEVRREA